MTDKHTKKLAAAQAALSEAQRAYATAREAYVMARLLRIRSGQPVEPSILSGQDGANCERRESVARSNAELDAETRRQMPRHFA